MSEKKRAAKAMLDCRTGDRMKEVASKGKTATFKRWVARVLRLIWRKRVACPHAAIEGQESKHTEREGERGDQQRQYFAQNYPPDSGLQETGNQTLPPVERHEKAMRMRDRLLRRREVERITGLSNSSIYRLMPQGKFPERVYVSSKAVRWRESDINDWLDSRPSEGGES